MNILFAGTPEFALAPLTALAEQHRVIGVYTQPDRRAGRGKKLTPPPVKVLANQLGIPVHQPTTLSDQVSTIEALAPDVIVVVAYGMLLPQSILDLPSLGCINIHASLLPRWRGAAPIQRAIEAGDKTTGVSIMRMEAGLDTGPVYRMLEVDIDPHETSATLHDKLSELGARGIRETLGKLCETPNWQAVGQDHNQATYARKITKQEAIIDWQQNAADIERRLRAFTPWPGCQTTHSSTRLRVWQATVLPRTNVAAVGEVVAVSDRGVTVACKDSALRIEVLQRDGSKALPVSEFRNGYTIAVGDVLN